MESACNRIREKSKRRKVNFDPTREPYILKVGSRSSSNFYRVYQKTKNINRSVYTESTDGLEFELEVKKDVIKSFQQFLFNNHVEEFEKRLTQHFFNQSKKNFGLNFYYTDWIRDFYSELVYSFYKLIYYLVENFNKSVVQPSKILLLLTYNHSNFKCKNINKFR